MAEEQEAKELVRVAEAAASHTPEHGSTNVHVASYSGTPWWQSSLVVTVLGALAAAVAPVTAGVQATIQKNKELAAVEREQDFKMRMTYLDLAIDPSRSPADRQAVLRFLRMASKDEGLLKWADAELERVDGELNELKQELKKKEDAIAEQARVEASVRAELEALKRDRAANEKRVRELEEQLAAAEGRKASVEAAVTRIQAQLKPGGSVNAAAGGAVEGGAAAPGRFTAARPMATSGSLSSSARCEAGTVRAKPVIGVTPELARATCEQALQENPELSRRIAGLSWDARVSTGAGESTVVCLCKPAGF